MKNYQSTAAQARFIESLAHQVGREAYLDAYHRVAIGQTPWCDSLTIIQASRKLSKKNASKLIDALLEIRDNPEPTKEEAEPAEAEAVESAPVGVPQPPACPECGGELATNTWECWCFDDCGYYFTKDEKPELFKAARAMSLAHTEAVAPMFDEMLTR